MKLELNEHDLHILSELFDPHLRIVQLGNKINAQIQAQQAPPPPPPEPPQKPPKG